MIRCSTAPRRASPLQNITVTGFIYGHATASDGTGTPSSFTGGTLNRRKHPIKDYSAPVASLNSLTVRDGASGDNRVAPRERRTNGRHDRRTDPQSCRRQWSDWSGRIGRDFGDARQRIVGLQTINRAVRLHVLGREIPRSPARPAMSARRRSP